jgi:hypothetical protein
MDPLSLWAMALAPQNFPFDLPVLHLLQMSMRLHPLLLLALHRSTKLPSLQRSLKGLAHPSPSVCLAVTSPSLIEL